MKKFTAFLRTKKPRADHLVWADGDVVTVESLDEWTAETPLKHKTDMHGNGDYFKRKEDHDPHRNEFSEHHHDLSPVHKEHIAYYKTDSYSTNHYLRHGKFSEAEDYRDPEEAKDHIKHMDHVTSYRTKHHHMTFRGGVPGDIRKFKPGHKFQDHGYTGTSFRHETADDFSKVDKKRGKRVIHVIHSPKGTKAHYIDVHGTSVLSSEHEMVLHRGTKFKVTHHSEDEHHHYIHSRVVAQHPKKLGEGKPGRHYSPIGYAEHQNKKHGIVDHGHEVTMTKHEDHPVKQQHPAWKEITKPK